MKFEVGADTTSTSILLILRQKYWRKYCDQHNNNNLKMCTYCSSRQRSLEQLAGTGGSQNSRLVHSALLAVPVSVRRASVYLHSLQHALMSLPVRRASVYLHCLQHALMSLPSAVPVPVREASVRLWHQSSPSTSHWCDVTSWHHNFTAMMFLLSSK